MSLLTKETTMKTAMKTTMTLGEIRAFHPCEPGWKKLIAECGTSADEHVVDLRDILRSNGPRDAWWATRCLPRRERVALALRAARTVERLSPAAKKCNDVTERWLRGDASDDELASAAAAAWDAAAALDAARAARAAEALDAAAAARAEAWMAVSAAWAARAAWDAAAAARAAAARAAMAASAARASAAARAEAWKNLGEIMLQWCDEQED
jgi:hypothetical protein